MMRAAVFWSSFSRCSKQTLQITAVILLASAFPVSPSAAAGRLVAELTEVEQEQLFAQTLLLMAVDAKRVTRPELVFAERIDDSAFAAVCPPCGEKRSNFYAPLVRQVWLTRDSREKSLVHEYVHHIQHVVFGAEGSEGDEDEAMQVQLRWEREHGSQGF